jgi:glutamate--cysteine ligase
LLQKGANHVELRVLDVNPLTRSGIFAEDIRFIQLLILYLSFLPDDEFDDNAQIKSVEDVKAAAVFGNADIKRRAKEALNEIKSFTVRYYPEYTPIVDYQLNKLIYGFSYAEIVSREYSKDYMNKGLALAKSYQRGERDV